MEKIKIGIAGLGRLGKIHAKNLADRISGCELTAACSLVESELEQRFVDALETAAGQDPRRQT